MHRSRCQCHPTSLLSMERPAPLASTRTRCWLHDGFLNTLFRKKNPERGFVILDKSNYEEKIQTLSHVFKHIGHANGQLRNFAEVPLFLDSKASRLIQMADLIAYWIFRHYQSGDSRGFNLIKPHFARYGVPGAFSSGLWQLVSAETETRLAAIGAHQHPFPAPTPKPAAPE
ncbi:conserved hypothetical protein (plasmid) [Allorhizobium ampelinum S4]|uniref:DUF3800 domain-containing protein n=2 Tax=Allorhizobium TaxID=78526 RepID=B9K360_ALLAM|nr:conserved hypothetical protein [Allorhizobium ampelinum S4]